MGDLFNTFGTGKIKRVLNKKKRDEINDEKIEKEVIQKNLENIKIEPERQYQSTTLVPCDPKGEFPQQIYNLDLLIKDENCKSEVREFARSLISNLKKTDIDVNQVYG